MSALHGSVAPLWMPPALLAFIVVWVFAWYLIIVTINTLGDKYAYSWQIPRWRSALMVALTVPAVLIAVGGAIAAAALLVAAVGSILQTII